MKFVVSLDHLYIFCSNYPNINTNIFLTLFYSHPLILSTFFVLSFYFFLLLNSSTCSHFKSCLMLFLCHHAQPILKKQRNKAMWTMWSHREKQIWDREEMKKLKMGEQTKKKKQCEAKRTQKNRKILLPIHFHLLLDMGQ